MREKAYAKINLCLDVKCKRDDGYHELSMVMVPIDLYDIVEIGISRKMIFTSNDKYLPVDDKNTIIKAINILRQEYQFKENFRIHLSKHIPTQAGLAGGSSDGAATIRLVKNE